MEKTKLHKKLIKLSKRTCEDCGVFHKNRKDNKCNECRKKQKKLNISQNYFLSKKYNTEPIKINKKIKYQKAYELLGDDAFIDTESE